MIGGRRSADRALGAVPTPRELVEFMVALAQPMNRHSRILEPACGDCPFLKALAERDGLGHEFVGIDIDPASVRYAKGQVPFATVLEGDFLLWQPNERFDVVIGNPPYGIIGDETHYPIHTLKDRKDLYKRRFTTWHGKFNIYGAFIEHAVNLLNPGGKLVFVVPASWLVLDDFTKLRQFLANSGHLSVYYFGKVFPGRNVSCVVFLLVKSKKGLMLYDRERLVVSKPDWSGDIIRFETPQALAYERQGIPLEQLFEIHFAARSPQVRSHPQVVRKPSRGLVPILTGRNLRPEGIDYENCYSGFWMPRDAAPTLRPFYGHPHIVIGHTKGTRMVAAVDERCYPWREEFHLVERVMKLDLHAIVRYLCSEPVEEHLRSLYREMVPHLTRTMLKRVPLPKEFGVQIEKSTLPFEAKPE